MGNPVTAEVYYLPASRFLGAHRWVLKITIGYDDLFELYAAKPTKKQIRQAVKYYVKWSR